MHACLKSFRRTYLSRLRRRLPSTLRSHADGTLVAKVHYTMRGENELLLRVAFHQSAREKWKDVAQLMSLSDGFRGKILSASASDPYDTRHPFVVDYEISQPKFVDWSKQPVRIPPMLPQMGMPELPAKSGSATSPDRSGHTAERGCAADATFAAERFHRRPDGNFRRARLRDIYVALRRGGQRDLRVAAHQFHSARGAGGTGGGLQRVPARGADGSGAAVHAGPAGHARQNIGDEP